MRRILSLLLSVVLVFTLAVPAMAATVKQEATSSAIKAGEEVTVTVTLDEDVADIVMYQYSLYYNKDLFTMTGSTGSAVVSNPLSDKDGDYFMISFVDTTSEGVTISAGTLAALTFQAKADMTEEQAASFLLRQDYFWDTSYEDIDGISLENGTVSVTVSPAVPEIKQYTVTLPKNPVGYTITPTEGSVSPVEEGGSFSFTVTVDTDNYEGTPVVKAGETELTAVDGVYTIADITANQTVTVEGITQKAVEPSTYTVTLTEGTGYVIAPANGSTNPVTAGSSFSFTVTVLDGYVGDVSVKANSTSLAQVDGVYTITNIN
jgi:predicted RNA-binding protein with TRAM domain